MFPTAALSRRTRGSGNERVVLRLTTVPVLVLVLASACGSPSNSPGAPSGSPASSGGSNTNPDCSSQAIQSALPGGATIEKFDCAKVGDTEWAAARANPGPTVFFLKWDGTKWNAEDSDSVCGTASAGLPPKLLAYCVPASSSSPS